MRAQHGDGMLGSDVMWMRSPSNVPGHSVESRGEGDVFPERLIGSLTVKGMVRVEYSSDVSELVMGIICT